MKKKNSILTLIISAFIISLAGCNPKEKEKIFPSGGYKEGVFIVNEGGYGKSTASISFYNRTSGSVENDIYKDVNNISLGDVAQSVYLNNGKTYIVVNNSNKVEVVNSETFKSEATISGLKLPRYFISLDNNKGYISQYVSFGVNGEVKVVDLNNNTVTKTIAVGQLPENMLIYGGKLYVPNSGDSTISVINTSTDAVENTIKIGDAPKSILLDANNKFWVLTAGKKVYGGPPTYALDEAASTSGSLIRMDAAGNKELILSFASKSIVPGQLAGNSDKNKLYYTYGGKVFDFDIHATALNTAGLISKDFYSLGVDPVNNFIWGGAAKDFSSTDYVYRYAPSGMVVDSFKVGIAPNNFTFR